MTTTTLEPTEGGLRAQLDEPAWAAALAAAGIDGAGALAALPGAVDDLVGSAEVDDAVRETARQAAGPAPLVFEVLTGHGARGVLARITTDGLAAAVAARVVVPGAGGGEPTAVPGVELTLTRAEHVVGEIMRTFPPVGTERLVDDAPVALPRDVAVTVVRSLSDGDLATARAAYPSAADEIPDVLEALGRGTSASASVTLRSPGHAVVLQWLCTDDGWVALSTTGPDVVHTARSRDEVRGDLVGLVAGALSALASSTGRRSDG